MSPPTPLCLNCQVEEYRRQGYLRIFQLLTDHHLNAIANEPDAFQRGEQTVGIVPSTKSLDADARSKRTGQPYNEKPLLLENGQPADIVRDTWTHPGHHIEH